MTWIGFCWSNFSRRQDTESLLDKPTAYPPRTSTDDDSRMVSLVKMTVSQERSVRKIAPGTVLPKPHV